MLMGVSYDEFWNGDYTRLKYYKDLHNLRQEQMNQNAWWQGAYVFEAVSIALENKFSKKGTPAKMYPSEPHRITPMNEIEKEKEKEKIVNDFREQLNALTRKFEAKHKRGENCGS